MIKFKLYVMSVFYYLCIVNRCCFKFFFNLLSFFFVIWCFCLLFFWIWSVCLIVLIMLFCVVFNVLMFMMLCLFLVVVLIVFFFNIDVFWVSNLFVVLVIECCVEIVFFCFIKVRVIVIWFFYKGIFVKIEFWIFLVKVWLIFCIIWIWGVVWIVICLDNCKL